MDMSPQQQQDSLRRGGGQQENKRRTKSQSYRRQSAPSLVITKALTRSKTLSRETFFVSVSPETCSLVQSFLTSSDRSFLLHGHAQLKTGMQTQDRHLFLFNDILVVAKAKSANHFKQKARVCVCEMWTASCMEEVCEGSTNPERSFVMGWPTCNCVATFSSAEQKETWLSLLKSQIKEEKEKEEPKTIPLRVYGKGINTFAVIKTLPVSNCDSTNEVIRLALQQFGIIGNVKDFQLWVISKRDNTPYPLIGHEFPFSIHMNHMRHSVSQGGGRDTAALTEDRQKATQMEQLWVHKQCQFILKPRPTETLQQHLPADFTQKPFKRRRSLIAWAFWRGSSSHLNELSLTGAARGCLFGQPLSAVCVDDALPKPVMDMLAFLYHEGSWTRGIFRRPAGARGVRELRDSLDTGEFQLSLTRDHIFVIAGVFKDFLRSIPGSLLCCELHEDWMDVLEEEEEEGEQVQDIQRMICRLPKENALLLRYVLAMLHGIQGNAHENQMTSFNLSVCIAPSILWAPGAPCSPEVEGEGTKKVCELVKFMIDHCQQILGEAPSSLFGGPPQRLSPEETGSDLWTYPLTDSSYDSLENELENSSTGSPIVCSKSHFHSNPLQGSLDSILTFSDYDQDLDPNQTDRLHGVESPKGRRCDQDPLSVDSPSSLDSSDGQHTLRRRSEPAIAYAAKFQPCVRGSADGEDKLFNKSPKCQTRGSGAEPVSYPHGGRSAALEASSSSLSSTPNSLDSLDSLTSDLTYMMKQGPTKIHPFSISSGNRNKGNSPKESPPEEALSRGTLKGCMGLHPNSWLKKDRRLSLTQQDNLERGEENTTEGGAIEKSIALIPEERKAGGKGEEKLTSSNQLKTSCTRSIDAGGGLMSLRPGHKSRYLKPNSSSPPTHHRSTGSLQFPKAPWFYSSEPPLNAGQLSAISHPPAPQKVKDLKQSSPPVFYKHSGLSLFKRHKSQSIEVGRNAKLSQRRGSEPGQQIVAPVLTRVRLPSDPGLKVSEVDSEAHPCLSPSSTKVVKDYFSTHPHSNPHSSQQVALALVESHREWLKRCSDPKAEPDLDQLLFAEESYV